MFTPLVPCCSILGPVLFGWRGVVNVPGCLFSPLPPGHVRKITSPPQLCQKKKDTKEKWGWMGVRVSRLSAERLAV